jgi:pimeloyl-ACP methyl ester carboxylesterase
LFEPSADRYPGPRPLLVLLPGGGYARGYFDLPVPDFSEAEFHAANGFTVLALDHLGVGDSTIVDRELSSLEAVAAATDAAVAWARSHASIGTVLGIGQSMGGHVTVATQAMHHTFDGIALLGSSVAGTTFPTRPGTPPPVVPERTTELEMAMLRRTAVDWNWAFHYHADEAPAVDPSEPPHDLISLVACDISAGLPAKSVPVPWASTTFPGFVADVRYNDVVAGLAREIDVPVLLAAGERDVTRPFSEESAVFAHAPSVTRFSGERMAHMHNFSETRQDLWRALEEFATDVAATTSR